MQQEKSAMPGAPTLRTMFAWGSEEKALMVGIEIARGGARDREAAEALARELLTTLRAMPRTSFRFEVPDYDGLDDMADEPDTLDFLKAFGRVLEAHSFGGGDAIDSLWENHGMFLRGCLAGTFDDDAEEE